ncbi:hypothetical protein DNFV4_04517 [Nitrospira tepida]|uniref:Uncharacterized protein n=2 Tax=Nitrospira tepida TaxID=2973512 RepID=A0AA86N3B9_9BACT|nr:hypothetical protein DNFV4_04517 [Nitrospira tepida]
MHDGSVNIGTQCENDAGSKGGCLLARCFSLTMIDPRWLILLMYLWPWSAWAQNGEPVPIEELLAAPDRYHLHQVLVRGTVENVRPFDPYQLNNGTICYAAYSFRVVDQTGALPVLVMGRCQIPLVKDPDVADGETVLVEVTIQQPGRDLFFMALDGRRIPVMNANEVQAMAVRIWPLPPEPSPEETPDLPPRPPLP